MSPAVAGYCRHPTVHGDSVVFVCEDDLWSVSTDGGLARRLTATPATPSFPVHSPDGSRIAFTGRDEGPSEVYVMDAAGGAARRLTWLGAVTQVVGWRPDGSAVICATDWRQPFRGFAHLWAVPVDGGPPEPLQHGPARSISHEPGGKGVVIGRNSGDPARWKRYRGGTAGTLWVDRKGDGTFEPLVRLGGNLANPMWVGDRVFFLSDHEGWGNLYSCTPAGKDLRRHTHHQDFYARFPSTDGRRIVYHAGADLYVFDPASGRSRRVDARVNGPRAQRNRKFVAAPRYLESFDLHPEGHSLAAVARGGAFTMALWEGAGARHGAVSSERHRLARWLRDGKRLVAVADGEGEEGLVVYAADGSTPPRRIAADLGRPLEMVAAPAGADRVAIANHRQEVVLVDLESGHATVVERSEWDRIDGLAWSPDGRWLAYGFPETRRTCSVHLLETATGKVSRATRPDFRDVQPAFDPEGRWLYFVSWRVFDPVYDSHYFDLGFPRGSRPFLVTLRKDVCSPFSSALRAPRSPAKPCEPCVKPPESSGKPADVAKTVDAPGKPADADAASRGPAPAAIADVRIDLDGIEDRVEAFPVPEGRYGRVLGAKGRALFTSFPHEGSLEQNWATFGEPPAKGKLEAWLFDAQKAETVADRVTDFALSADAETLAVRSGNRLRVVAATATAKDLPARDEACREAGWVDLDRLRVGVVPGDEWRQMYREAWRLQRDQFWTQDMSGVDWKAVHDRYLPLVERVASRAEFSDLMWEMQGELGTSHCYELGGDYRPEPQWHQGFLGADLAWDAASSTWRVAAIPRGDSWDAARSSPLAVPGTNVRPGDEILEVGGETVARDASPYERLVNLAGRDVSLTVRDASGARRAVAVRTMRDETGLRYRHWVEANRALVHARTGGRVGYVHIPNMGPVGYSEFHRYYLSEVDHEGLVIDVRWNGGGHVSQLLIEKLRRSRMAYNFSRWAKPTPYPDDAPVGPMVALTNEYAGSDGDIFSHVFKLSRLGPLIGMRTWGGVVGIWPRHALVDGTITTQPEFANWFRDVGWKVENYGTDPDIVVEITPQDHAAGRDPQMERALVEIERILAATKPALPSFDARPALRPPVLPDVDLTSLGGGEQASP